MSRRYEIFKAAGISLLLAVSVNAQEPDGEKLVNANDCSGCHAVNSQVVGPSYSAIAKRYRGQNDAVEKLAAPIREGGSGKWGSVAMTPHAALPDSQIREMVKWILSLKDPAPAPARPTAESKSFSYTLKDGKTVKLDFPLFAAGKGQKVTKSVFRGYELYNSYCYRCHGTDAAGSQLAPDLRHSLSAGMTRQQFLSIAMAGKADKGMPSWAGFLSREDITSVYQYVKGRSLDLVPPGRPPSEVE